MKQEGRHIIFNNRILSIICLFIFSLIFFTLIFFGIDNQNSAYADQASIDKAKAELESFQKEYDNAKFEADSIQDKINLYTEEALEAQNKKISSQKAFNDVCSQTYKNGISFSYIGMILNSSNISELLDNIEYVQKIMKNHADIITEQERARIEFENSINNLNGALDEYNNKITQINNKVSQTHALIEKLEQEDAAMAEYRNMIPGQIPDDGGSWKSGIASAYGGSSDPGSGSRTASGDEITDFSMGVAVPISLPNYKSLFGSRVIIKLGGRTVIGIINDCGSMGGGSRVLDVQPGIFKGFGYSSCQDWGVRNIEYRII